MEKIIGTVIGLIISFIMIVIAFYSFDYSAFIFIFILYMAIAYLYFLHRVEFSRNIVEPKIFTPFENNLFEYFHVYVRYPGASRLLASTLSTTGYFSLVFGIYGVYDKNYALSFLLIVFPILARGVIKRLDPISHLKSIRAKNFEFINSAQIEVILNKYHAKDKNNIFSENSNSNYFLGSNKRDSDSEPNNESRDWSKEIQKIIDESNYEIFNSSDENSADMVNSFDLGPETPEEQYEIGNMYLNGNLYNPIYPERNYVKALGWFEKSAAQGNAKAQFTLGWMLLRSKGAHDPVLANAYFRLSFKHGNKDAESWFRDNEGLSSEDIAEAEFLASNWTSGTILSRLVG